MEFGLSPIPGFLFLCPFLRFGSARTQLPAAPIFFIFSPSSYGVSAALLFFPNCSFSFPSCSFFFRAAVFLLRRPAPCCLSFSFFSPAAPFLLPSFRAPFSAPFFRLPSSSSRLLLRVFFLAPPFPHTLFPHTLFPHTLLPHAPFPHTLLPHAPFPHTLFPHAFFSRPLSRALSFPHALFLLAPLFPVYTLPGLNPLPSLNLLQPAPRLNGTAADGTVRNGVLMSAQSFSVPLQVHPGRFMLPNC